MSKVTCVNTIGERVDLPGELTLADMVRRGMTFRIVPKEQPQPAAPEWYTAVAIDDVPLWTERDVQLQPGYRYQTASGARLTIMWLQNKHSLLGVLDPQRQQPGTLHLWSLAGKLVEAAEVPHPLDVIEELPLEPLVVPRVGYRYHTRSRWALTIIGCNADPVHGWRTVTGRLDHDQLEICWNVSGSYGGDPHYLDIIEELGPVTQDHTTGEESVDA